MMMPDRDDAEFGESPDHGEVLVFAERMRASRSTVSLDGIAQDRGLGDLAQREQLLPGDGGDPVAVVTDELVAPGHGPHGQRCGDRRGLVAFRHTCGRSQRARGRPRRYLARAGRDPAGLREAGREAFQVRTCRRTETGARSRGIESRRLGGSVGVAELREEKELGDAELDRLGVGERRDLQAVALDRDDQSVCEAYRTVGGLVRRFPVAGLHRLILDLRAPDCTRITHWCQMLHPRGSTPPARVARPVHDVCSAAEWLPRSTTAWYVPISTNRPACTTATRCARCAVESRAITMTVRPSISRSGACSISSSVPGSSDDVASSSTTTAGSASAARTRDTSCRSPAVKLIAATMSVSMAPARAMSRLSRMAPPKEEAFLRRHQEARGDREPFALRGEDATGAPEDAMALLG